MVKKRAWMLGGVVAVAAAVIAAASPWALSAYLEDPKSNVSAAVDPAEGLPDAEREAAYQAQLTAHAEARNGFIAQFEEQARSVAELRQVELLVSPVEPRPTLAAALDASDLVVRAVVSDLTFTPSGTVATLAVEDVVHGTPPAVLRTNIGGGPEPDPAYTTGVLAIDPSMPFLFEGTRALLLLHAEPSGTALPAPYSVQPGTGTYLIAPDGTVSAHHGNPFKNAVDGLTAAAFTDLLERTLAR